MSTVECASGVVGEEMADEFEFAIPSDGDDAEVAASSGSLDSPQAGDPSAQVGGRRVGAGVGVAAERDAV